MSVCIIQNKSPPYFRSYLDSFVWFQQFGEVVATTEHDEAIIISEIDYSQVDLRR